MLSVRELRAGKLNTAPLRGEGTLVLDWIVATRVGHPNSARPRR